MAKRRYAHLIVDCLLFFLMLAQMSSQFSGLELHEYFGLEMTIVFVLHQVLNRHFYASLFRGRYTGTRVLLTVTDVLTIAAFLLMILSGLSRSHYLFHDKAAFLGQETATALHLFSGYLAFLLTGFHCGLHHPSLRPREKKQKKSGASYVARAGKIILLIALFGAGVYAFIADRFWDYLSFQAHFVIFPDVPAFVYELGLVCLWLSLVFIGLFLRTRLARRNSLRNQPKAL